MFKFSRLIVSGAIVLSLLALMSIQYWSQTATAGTIQATQTDPPFSGTIFLSPHIITSSDPTTFSSLSYAGQGERMMFDRRVNDWIFVNAYLFDVVFDDGLTAEIQVNPEFGDSEAALVDAEKYAVVIGRLPTALRVDVQTVWIHKGTEPFGGGNNNLLIHTGQADLYEADGILEETLVHEAVHTSLDAAHANAPDWLAAQVADGTFISTYARDYPDREDIAESFLPYLAIRHRSDRISSDLANTILQTIPNRIAYFDAQAFNMYPLTPPPITPPSLTINHLVGQPGSFFTVTGSNYPPDTTVAVTINGYSPGNVSADGSGELAFILDTTQADEGVYAATTTTAEFSLTVAFRLDPLAPLHPQEGSGPIFAVPEGIALTEAIYLPIILR